MKFPVHEAVEVLDGKTLYKTEKWWKAIVICRRFGKKEICIYLWKKTEKGWKRQQKYSIKDERDWLADKEVIEEFIKKM
jgi:hypothetical protein